MKIDFAFISILLLLIHSTNSIKLQQFETEETQNEIKESFSHSIEGRLEILHADHFEAGISKRFYLLHSSFHNEVYHLEFPSLSHRSRLEKDLVPHDYIVARGNLILNETRSHFWAENHKILQFHDFSSLSESESYEDSDVESEGFLSDFNRWKTNLKNFNVKVQKKIQRNEKRSWKRATGKQIQQISVAVVVLNFQDSSIPCDTSAISQAVYEAGFGVTKTFTSESFGYVSISPSIGARPGFDLYGPYNIQATAKSGSCEAQLWADRGEEAMKKAGVDLGSYDYRVFVLPAETSKICQWQGLGIVGPGCFQVCRAWINTCERAEIYIHELGHNVGMSHAGTDFGERDFNVEYGDVTDFMGNSVYKPGVHEMIFNVAKRDEAGWFGKEGTGTFRLLKFDGFKNQSYYFQKGEIDGSYALSPSNSDFPENPIGIRIWSQEASQYYYISYETQPTPWIYKGIVLSYRRGANSRVLKLLNVGDSFVDKNGRFSFKVSSMDSSKMVVDLHWGCVKSSTGLFFRQVLSEGNQVPLQSSNQSNILLQYKSTSTVQFNVSNTDSPLCPTVMYSFSIEGLPSGVTAKFDPPTLFLMGNQNCLVNLVLNQDQNSQEGTYSYQIRVSGTNTAGETLDMHQGSIAGVLTIDSTCQRNFPTILTNATEGTIGRGESFALQYSIQDHSSSNCPSIDFLVTFKVSNGLSASIGRQRVTLSPGQTSSSDILLVTSPSAGFFNASEVNLSVLSVINVTLFSRNANPPSLITHSGPLIASTSLLLYSGEPCGILPFSITLDQNITTNQKTAVSSVLRILSPETQNCVPSSVSVSSDNSLLQFTPNPITINPGETGIVTVIVNAGEKDDLSKNIQISVTDNTYSRPSSGSVPLQLTINPVSCSPQTPVLDKGFPLTYEPSLGQFSMWVQAVNYDGWACPDSNFQMSAVFQNGLTWKWVPEQYGNQAPIFLIPGNYTNRLYLNVTVPTAPAFQSIDAVFSLTDPGSSSHSTTFNIHVPIQQCIRIAPNLTLVDPNVTSFCLYQGETVSFNLQLFNNDPNACDYFHIYDGTRDSSLFSFSATDDQGITTETFGPSTAQLYSNQSTNFNAKITVSNLFPASNVTINTTVTITVKDSKNLNHTASLNVTVFVVPGCIKNTPKITVFPTSSNLTIKTGDIARVPIEFNVTNMDDGPLCNGTTYGLTGGIPSPSGGWDLLSGSDSDLFFLPYNSTVNQTIIAVTRENLAAGSANAVVVGVYENSDQITHISTVPVKIGTTCPIPSAPRSLTAVPSQPAFSFLLQTKPNYITWEGCSTKAECCCPCTFVISRNGVEIGRTQLRNFTDGRKLKNGESYQYSVAVIDAKGIRSPSTVCGDKIVAVAEAPPIAAILIFLVVATLSLLAFAGLLFGIYILIDRMLSRPALPPSLRRGRNERSFASRVKSKFLKIWRKVTIFFGRVPPETETHSTELPAI